MSDAQALTPPVGSKRGEVDPPTAETAPKHARTCYQVGVFPTGQEYDLGAVINMVAEGNELKQLWKKNEGSSRKVNITDEVLAHEGADDVRILAQEEGKEELRPMGLQETLQIAMDPSDKRINWKSMIAVLIDGDEEGRVSSPMPVIEAVNRLAGMGHHTPARASTAHFYLADGNELGYCSNFSRSEYIRDGTTFSCVEQDFQYEKIMFLAGRRAGEDRRKLHDIASAIVAERNPFTVKMLGKGREDGEKDGKMIQAARLSTEEKRSWDARSKEVMFRALTHKFSFASELADQLGDTYPAYLEERTSKDEVWGSGSDSAGGKGENRLGKLLMRVRTRLRAIKALTQ
jgi:ribA/ribD-fused uncharacterized protein